MLEAIFWEIHSTRKTLWHAQLFNNYMSYLFESILLYSVNNWPEKSEAATGEVL